jgi:hypothetical protein
MHVLRTRIPGHPSGSSDAQQGGEEGPVDPFHHRQLKSKFTPTGSGMEDLNGDFLSLNDHFVHQFPPNVLIEAIRQLRFLHPQLLF